MLNADLTPEEREVVQKRVEKLHRGPGPKTATTSPRPMPARSPIWTRLCF
jgi:hypothetical protein